MNDEVTGLELFIVLYCAVAFMTLAFSHINEIGIFKWARKAPTKDARLFIWVVGSLTGPPLYLVVGIYRFFKGAYDLLPKRKPKMKIPEARIHHG